MHARCKLLFSTIAATFLFSAASFGNEPANDATTPADNGAPTGVNQVDPNTDSAQAVALATPLPSVDKILDPDKTEGLNQNPGTQVSPPLTDTLPKAENPFLYDEPEAPSTTPGPKELSDAPAVATPNADQAIAKAIESTLQYLAKGKSRLERKDHDAVVAFYTDHGFDALWVKDNALTPQAIALMDRLSKAEEDGLNRNDYAIALPKDAADAAALATFEIGLSKIALHYARDAQAGRIIPSQVSDSIKLEPLYPDPQAVMLKLATSANKAAALASYNPPHAAYKALRRELIRLRAEQDIPRPPVVPSGESMYEGYEGPRVAILRERLNVPALANEDGQRFDATLKQAVKAFQSENNLIADGVVGPRTLDTINGEHIDRIPDIIANMERWRWMARDLGKLHVAANIPSYDVTVKKDGVNIHRTRVVVGKPKHMTPVFSDQMEFVVVNPYWNVPYSIASKELLPNIRANPGFVSNKNYQVLSGNQVVNPTSVNWDENAFKRLRIRQLPGDDNALGNVKFLFPNDYSIYFHDTPSKSLFDRAVRAFSHGCVRIHNPFEFGDVLMQEAKGWRNGTLESMVGGKEKWIRLNQGERIPVHITYFTAVADAEGQISYKSDVYGHNTRLKQALGLI